MLGDCSNFCNRVIIAINESSFDAAETRDKVRQCPPLPCFFSSVASLCRAGGAVALYCVAA